MKVEEIKEMIEKDAKFLKEESNIDIASLSVPELCAKYHQLIYDETMILNYLKTEYKTTKRDRWMYYTGKSDKPFDLVILKTDVDKFLDADEKLNNSLLKLQAQEEKINLLTEQVKAIMSLSFNIGNAIKWKKFLSGEIG
tara:strand:+ start:1290 stop:1709 length:420 start_codon:yes stop_codon:yes gene_type:complete